MNLISIGTASTLTEWSERTIWRRLSDGSLPRQTGSGKLCISLESIQADVCIPLEPADIQVLMHAESGDATAQTDLALIFLEQNKPKSAVYWLESAAKQGNADAMHWMGRCYIDGIGLQCDDNLGLMWLSKAAAAGHPISQEQMQTMRDRFVAR